MGAGMFRIIQQVFISKKNKIKSASNHQAISSAIVHLIGKFCDIYELYIYKAIPKNSLSLDILDSWYR